MDGGAEPKFASDDPIGEIEDPIARYLARTIVHVRRFFPFYVGGVAFLVAMLVLPAVGNGGGGDLASSSSSIAGSGGAAGVASTGGRAAAASGGRSATGAGAAAAGSSDLLASFADDDLGGEVAAGAPAGGTGAAAHDGRRSAGAPVAVPETPDSDIPETPEPPSACAVAAPSPAPAVTPKREVSGAQDTVESAARASLPVDVAETSSPVTDDAVCSVPEAPVALPTVPLPATPVGGTTPGTNPLQLALSLLFR
jgi:hypothetical protein